VRLRAWCLALALAIGCTDADLESAPVGSVVLDDKLQVTGQFCTGLPDPAQFPVRILFMSDTSGSMAVSDPTPAMNGGPSRRVQAVINTMDKYPPGPAVEYGLITFNSTSSILTVGTNNLPGFTSDQASILSALGQFEVYTGQTDFDGALAKAYQMLQADMDQLDSTAKSRARYEIIFMSDGAPDPDNTGPGESLPDDVRTDVQNIVGLQTTQQLGLVSLNTVYINAAMTPAEEVFQASTLMSAMASLGNGTFRQVNSNQDINLFYIDFTSVVRTYALKSFVVSNTTEHAVAAPAGAAIGTIPGVDTDGDGLTDDLETLIGTSPLLTDTDGDGFSDFLEYQLRNSGFDPLYPDDADCVQTTDKEDADGDGLLNCEERYVGTSLQLADTDADGYSDDIEYHNGTNPIVADARGDLDFDSAPNGFELSNHTDPLRDDVADFSQIAYRYDVQALNAASGGADAGAGQTCYQFTVDNITLAPTASTVPGTLAGGTNTVLLHVISTTSDNPNDPGTQQIACIRPRYQQSPQVKSPLSGSMNVPQDAFKTPGLGPDGGVGFDENRDCIVP